MTSLVSGIEIAGRWGRAFSDRVSIRSKSVVIPANAWNPFFALTTQVPLSRVTRFAAEKLFAGIASRVRARNDT
jgi:hypothetical protein